MVKYTAGDTFSCFDNESGEFSARITAFEKRHTRINILAQTEPFTRCPDIWLLFAPLKKDKTDFVIEKATELGCRKILPVITRHTNSGNVKTERYVAQSIDRPPGNRPGTKAGRCPFRLGQSENVVFYG